jgi:glycosyltransferase involved in cell wall biosynthesis
MQIAIISDYGTINGGAAKIALVSAQSLAERGHEIHFVCATGSGTFAIRHSNIHYHHLGMADAWTERNPARAAARGIWNRTAARYVHDLLADFEPQKSIVHFHQWTKAFSPSVIGAVARSALPSIFTLHGYFLFCPNGIYFDHGCRRPCQRRPLSTACVVAACDSHSYAHKVVRLIRQVGSNAALRRISQPLNLIHVSFSARELARPHFPAATRHFVVPNPSTMPKANPVDVRSNRMFIYIGRLTPEKGPVVFARAARALAGVRVAFMGEGPEVVRLLHANPSVELYAWDTDAAVEALLGRARALVFPSLWQETSGLVVLEALSKGVPVICSRITGAADWIVDGVNGFLVAPGDLVGLQARLKQLAEDDNLAAGLGAEAYRRYWQEGPPIQVHAERLEAVYDAILNGQGASDALFVQSACSAPTGSAQNSEHGPLG